MPANTKPAAHPAKSNRATDLQFISRTRAAQLLDSDAQLVDKLIRQQRLRAYRVGRKVILRLDELLALVEEGRVL